MAKPRKLPHRVIVSLDEHTHSVLKEIADADSKAVATLIREVLVTNLNELQKMAQVIRLIKADRWDEAAALAKQAIEDAERKAENSQIAFLKELEAER